MEETRETPDTLEDDTCEDEEPRQVLALFTTVCEKWMVDHPINEICLLAFLAAMCNAHLWSDITYFGTCKLKDLRFYSPFAAGIPTPGTMRHAMGLIDTKELPSLVSTHMVNTLYAKRYTPWLNDPTELDDVDDYDESDHTVSRKPTQAFFVWDAKPGICLYALEGEASQASQWLRDEANTRADAIISADDRHIQPDTARTIISRGGDYVVTLTDDGSTEKDALKERFRDLAPPHGTDKHELREELPNKLTVTEVFRTDPAEGAFADWEGLRSLVCQVKTVTPTAKGSEAKVEISHCLSSLTDVEEIAGVLHRHEICEGSYHLFDDTQGKDKKRDAERNGFENRAYFDKLSAAIAKLMKAHPTHTERHSSVVGIRQMFGWETVTSLIRMYEAVDRSAFEEAVTSIKLTYANKKRYHRILEEAEAMF